MFSLTCPNCGASVDAEDGLDTFYCKYCGYKIMLDGQSDAAYRAKTRVKQMFHEEKMLDKMQAQERYKLNQKNREEYEKIKRGILIAVACVALFFIVFGGFFGSAKRKSDKEEAMLQELVEEIQVDIANGDFDVAYVKAQSIRCTENWSDEIEEKWDNTRKAVIDQIILAEKEATGKSEHKPEKDGLFGLFD